MTDLKNIRQPLQWLEILNKTIGSAKCRINDKEVSFVEGLGAVTDLLRYASEFANTVWWVGNGGSAAICSHLSQDMMNKLGIKSYCFNDSSLMTCMANDYGYENVYARPLTVHASENDILIAISSSGNSANILNAVDVATKENMQIITLSGMKEDNKLWNTKSNVSFWVSSDLYGIVEVSHEAILHGIIETMWLENR
ncbi:SIS domain-containing protein [Desulfobacterales bacterium HSG17]|nr:SIS domain-containing protein [Desulfobacterales bacterium HSG17]